MTDCHFLVPGALDRPTGGSRYDQTIVTGLRAAGRSVAVHELPGRYPDGDATARQTVAAALSRIPAGQRVIVDGLVLGGLADVFAGHAQRLRLDALIHHPLADETGIDPDRARQWLADEARAVALAERVITTSRFTAHRLSVLGIHHGSVHVIPPGCAPRPLATGSPGDNPVLLCVASLTPRKAQHHLLDALSRLTDRPWYCRLVGPTDLDPDYAAAIAAQRDRLALGDRVEIDGAVGADQLDTAYRTADLFILPSVYEGFGMVISEAVAHGLPIVTTTGGALATTLPEGAGIAVRPDDPEALATALASVLDHPERRHDLARGARRARDQLNSWNKSVADFIDLLEEDSSCPSDSRPSG
ncbi:glycosyltransferase family 4 protein [Spiribacter vilamensis]|uniref:Glycosyltransferase involved in cell wall biosynthesis n=1 Tax=Spiribacter vilamensis TaxID=531306 RepID=A0A4Q8CYK8_9GAMM|nr:glycosyltransferase family 4 protein [Spiribacter vilamensis]RZU98071.1 glycosyltransferase involved in cell wall biosynthesis [Spiribacter vilamensis]